MTAAERLMLEGERRVILRLLHKRFDGLAVDVEEKISEGSEAELARWSISMLDADTLEDVFADAE